MPRSSLIDVFDELRRRHVFRVAAAYLVSGWVVLEVSGLLADIVRDGDILVTQGAGSIGRLARDLQAQFGGGVAS